MSRVVFLLNIINIKHYMAVPMSSIVASDGNITCTLQYFVL